MEEFFNAISNFGFPIVVSAYLLFRFERKLDDLKKSIDEFIALEKDRKKR